MIQVISVKLCLTNKVYVCVTLLVQRHISQIKLPSKQSSLKQFSCFCPREKHLGPEF